MKRIFVDYKKCLACKACETACATRHHPSGSLLGALGDRRTEINVRVLAVEHEAFPLSCRHCDPADCLTACPSGALRREPQQGAVLIDPSLCKACAMCASVCTFDAIAFKETHRASHGRDVAHKCDLCVARTSQGEQPACVAACHSGALTYGEMDEGRYRRAGRNLRTYLLGEEGLPAHIALYRELRQKECARRRGDEQ